MYLRIFNKANPYQTMIVEELSDFLFEEGWRLDTLLGNNVTTAELHQADEDLRQTSIRQYGF